VYLVQTRAGKIRGSRRNPSIPPRRPPDWDGLRQPRLSAPGIGLLVHEWQARDPAEGFRGWIFTPAGKPTRFPKTD